MDCRLHGMECKVVFEPGMRLAIGLTHRTQGGLRDIISMIPDEGLTRWFIPCGGRY